MAENSQPTRAQLEEAEEYLRGLDLPEDDWIVKQGQQFYALGQAADNLFGLSVDAVRKRAEDGDIPGAIQLDERHWRLPRSGLIYYIAQQRRRQGQMHAG
jgi:hypothetical protein